MREESVCNPGCFIYGEYRNATGIAACLRRNRYTRFPFNIYVYYGRIWHCQTTYTVPSWLCAKKRRRLAWRVIYRVHVVCRGSIQYFLHNYYVQKLITNMLELVLTKHAFKIGIRMPRWNVHAGWMQLRSKRRGRLRCYFNLTAPKTGAFGQFVIFFRGQSFTIINNK